MTDTDGRFRSDQLPKGKATIWVHKTGYCRPGLGEVIETPKTEIELRMIKSARVRITVDFAGKERPGAYIVHMVPEGGEAVGKWSGSGNINADDQIYFNDIPPGRYVLHGLPNPGSEDQKTEPLAIELKGGQAKSISLRAR
jgi:hypothetical protein